MDKLSNLTTGSVAAVVAVVGSSHSGQHYDECSISIKERNISYALTGHFQIVVVALVVEYLVTWTNSQGVGLLLVKVGGRSSLGSWRLWMILLAAFIVMTLTCV